MVSVGRVVGLWLLLTLLSPLLVSVAALVDTGRFVMGRRDWVTLRLLAFGWVFFFVETVGIVRLAATWLPRRRRVAAAYRIQRWFARTLLDAVLAIFSMRLEVEGEEHITPGPVMVFVRHASIVDNLLPPVILSDRNGLRMRWVLKRELLSDPALDIGGNRLPNHFVDRSGTDSQTEVAAIADLGSDLADDEGVVIYPEGTRFTPERRARVVERLRRRDPESHRRAQALRHVLPPRLGGPLMLLEHGTDVLFMAHHGLEGFSHLADIWRGGMVGATIRVRVWREAASSVPATADERSEWLWAQWAALDDWIDAQA